MTVTNNTNSKATTNANPYGPTPVQIGLGMLILGASAGLTLYTKKTQALLSQFKRASDNKAMRLPKKKFGPMTRSEADRVRSRWTEDDL
mmetsp:Transcript_5346/g.8182  ORF Transcript_5346/g.8182 Transcript_5346/m.8182 type:complete len:89 (-) Transcript_5346:504-770(-)